jgi:hypothetical protein
MNKQTQIRNRTNKQISKQTNIIPCSGRIEFQSSSSGVTPPASNPGIGF